MRGEKLTGTELSISKPGSPPRARGKDLDRGALGRLAGMTRAWAGKSTEQGGCGNQNGDHPRVRGEKNCRMRVRYESAGSPPRARGKAVVLAQAGVGLGITPACAGKRAVGSSTGCSTGDHPRMRGEK